MARYESQTLLTDTDDLFIKQVRGKYVINSMMDDLVFGIPGTLLECQECMDNATWRGVLIGPCSTCADKYNKHFKSRRSLGCGYKEKESADAMPIDDEWRVMPFGYRPIIVGSIGDKVCKKISKLLDDNGDNIPSQPRAIKTDDAYSFYGLAKLSQEAYDLMLNTPDAFAFFAAKYHINYGIVSKRFVGINKTLDSLAHEFDSDDMEFYKKCEKMEKEWILCKDATTQKEVDREMMSDEKKTEMENKKKVLKPCDYCWDIKETKVCSKCKSVRYCSVACQSKDWSKGGAYACLNGEMSSPHKETCNYLYNMKMEQERYEAGLDKDEDEYHESDYHDGDSEVGTYAGLF